jgi:hypothetical protein
VLQTQILPVDLPACKATEGCGKIERERENGVSYLITIPVIIIACYSSEKEKFTQRCRFWPGDQSAVLITSVLTDWLTHGERESSASDCTSFFCTAYTAHLISLVLVFRFWFFYPRLRSQKLQEAACPDLSNLSIPSLNVGTNYAAKDRRIKRFSNYQPAEQIWPAEFLSVCGSRMGKLYGANNQRRRWM